jgi:hypothetical protein
LAREHLISLLYLLLVFLSPLGLYCLALAYVNRSQRPILVPGIWDLLALLFGLSGFLLWTLPYILVVVVARALSALGRVDLVMAPIWQAPLLFAYYLAVAVWAIALLRARRNKTNIYNVDTERFADRLADALAELRLDCTMEYGRLVIAPVEAFSPTVSDAIMSAPLRVIGSPAKRLIVPPGGPRYADLSVDTFPTLSHVTLQWDQCEVPFRREIEHRLGQTLRTVPALENPSAGWLLGFSGLLLGTVIMISIFILLASWPRS